jgi:hypothetical protein
VEDDAVAAALSWTVLSAGGSQRPGTDVVIFKKFSQKNLAKKWRF